MSKEQILEESGKREFFWIGVEIVLYILRGDGLLFCNHLCLESVLKMNGDELLHAENAGKEGWMIQCNFCSNSKEG